TPATIQPIAITSGRLSYTPFPPNDNGLVHYTTFQSEVQDDGGTANGRADTDTTPNLMTIGVQPVNDAPTGTDKTVTTLENGADHPSAYTFGTADFGFDDPLDSPKNNLQAVRISSLPTAGALGLNGVTVGIGQL